MLFTYMTYIIPGITAIQAVATVASEITSAPSNSRKPEDEFNFRFETICNIIDILARQERADNGLIDTFNHDFV